MPAHHLAPAAPAIADHLHRGDPQRIAKGRVDGDDGIVADQVFGAIGALGDGEAEEQRVGEQADKADRDGVFPVAFEEVACA
mgnify:CR=1 FL=1